jgi:CheY-like chemotaxis protein
MNESTSINSDASPAGRCWLVVDDEQELSDLIADLLAQMKSARVESFTSSPDALAAFSARAGSFDLVVTDRDMPGLDGLELARRLRARAPGVKIILVSANTDDISSDDLKRAGVHAVVKKPFTLARLEAIVRNMTCDSAGSNVCASGPVLARAA